MDTDQALSAFAALSQPTRLDVFRLLVAHEPEGLAAGEVARRLDVPHNTLSTHFGILARAGLIAAERQSRLIIYRARLEAVRHLASFLLKECCGGKPEICAPLIADLQPCCPAGTQPADAYDAQGTPPMRPAMSPESADVTIFHNPACGTSRNVLGLIRNAGIEPAIVEYLKTPPTRSELILLITRMGIPVRALLREKGTPYAELGLDDPTLSDEALLDAMMAHPILINRPIVVTPRGVRLCRPSESVLDLLDAPQRGEFRKEDGQLVVDINGNRAA